MDTPKKVPAPQSLPEPIRQRLSLGIDRAEANSQAILERIGPERWKRYLRECEKLIRSSEPAWIRLHKLYDMVDEVASFVRPNAACHKGCSHCCLCAVAVGRVEADLIGRAIGRKPKAVTSRELDDQENFEGFVWGSSNPCTFLVNNECSIYEHRPLRCRTHFSVDVDNTLCVPQYPLSWDIYMFDMTIFEAVYIAISGGEGRYRAADIRDYFPKKD